MNQHPDPQDSSERVLREILRELPSRRAPASLEDRVLNALRRHAARPWWQQGFAQWPWYARAGFAVLCTLLVAITILDGSWAIPTRAWAVAGSLSLPWVQSVAAIVSSAMDLTALAARIVPPLWLYAGLTIGAVLYATLFGLGAAAYRFLYIQSSTGDPS